MSWLSEGARKLGKGAKKLVDDPADWAANTFDSMTGANVIDDLTGVDLNPMDAVNKVTENINTLSKPKTPPFGDTETGKNLAGIAETGVYSPAMRKSMLGESTAQASSIAQKREMDIKGGLQASGFEGSIAGQRLLSTPGSQAARTVSSEAARINRENELSKIDATRSLAAGIDITEAQRMSKLEADRARRKAERKAIMQSVLGVAGMAAGAYLAPTGSAALGASIGGKVGVAAGGGPLDVSGVARDIYAGKLSDARLASEEARQASYESGNRDDPLISDDVLDRYNSMSVADRINTAERYGMTVEDLEAFAINRELSRWEVSPGFQTPQKEQLTPLDTIGGQGHSDTIYGYGGN